MNAKLKYLNHGDFPELIEAAEEELLLHAVDLIRPDEVQDDRQRWKDAAAEIIATKDQRITELERVADEIAEVLLEQIISQGCACHFLDESLQPCLKCRTDAALASYAKWKGK